MLLVATGGDATPAPVPDADANFSTNPLAGTLVEVPRALWRRTL